MWRIKEDARDFTNLTYPFSLPQQAQDRYTERQSQRKELLPSQATKQANQAFAITQVLSMLLMDIDGKYYRDNFLDLIGMIKDFDVPMYERLSFGPGQRYASKGATSSSFPRARNPCW